MLSEKKRLSYISLPLKRMSDHPVLEQEDARRYAGARPLWKTEAIMRERMLSPEERVEFKRNDPFRIKGSEYERRIGAALAWLQECHDIEAKIEADKNRRKRMKKVAPTPIVFDPKSHWKVEQYEQEHLALMRQADEAINKQKEAYANVAFLF